MYTEKINKNEVSLQQANPYITNDGQQAILQYGYTRRSKRKVTHSTITHLG